jgi:hypothetical protein
VLPKTTVWAVYATFANGEKHALVVYADEKDARHHAEKSTRQPWDDDAREYGSSAAETLGIKTVTVAPLSVW